MSSYVIFGSRDVHASRSKKDGQNYCSMHRISDGLCVLIHMFGPQMYTLCPVHFGLWCLSSDYFQLLGIMPMPCQGVVYASYFGCFMEREWLNSEIGLRKGWHILIKYTRLIFFFLNSFLDRHAAIVLFKFVSSHQPIPYNASDSEWYCNSDKRI